VKIDASSFKHLYLCNANNYTDDIEKKPKLPCHAGRNNRDCLVCCCLAGVLILNVVSEDEISVLFGGGRCVRWRRGSRGWSRLRSGSGSGVGDSGSVDV